MRGRISTPIALAFVLLACSAAPASDWIEFEICTYDTPAGQRYDAEIWLNVDGVTGAGNVQGQIDGGGWFPFDWDTGYLTYTLETSDDLTLAGLNTEIEGDWELKVATAGGDAVYSFTINTVTAGMFAPMPVITSPADGAINVPWDQTFTWTWSGNTANVDGLFVEVEPVGGGAEWDGDESDGGGMAITDLSWQADMGPNTGQAWFCVGYDIYDPMDGTGVLSAITHDSGPDFGWDEADVLVTSDDEISMTVVPEPASVALLMLGLPLLASVRRRK